MNNNEYSSSEYKTKFVSELLSMFRIFIAVCLVIAPGPTLVCMLIYGTGKTILGKKSAKFYLFIVASVLLAVKSLIQYSDRDNFAELLGKEKSKIPMELAKTAKQLLKGPEGENAMTAAARFSVIAEGGGAVMFSGDGFNMEEAYTKNGVVLVLLNDFAYSEFAKSMGRLVIEDIKNLISRINSKALPEKEVLCVFDEVSVYINPQVMGMGATI